jgi:hypothetical protein
MFTALLLCLFLFLSQVYGASLLHRYSFSGNLQDSVGTAHGVETGGTISFSNGKGVFTGGPYVTLPSSSGVLGTDTAVTIDMWVDISAYNTGWCKLFQFGNSGNVI